MRIITFASLLAGTASVLLEVVVVWKSLQIHPVPAVFMFVARCRMYVLGVEVGDLLRQEAA